eukprot:CAMPEP_0179422572 /NCGR_PEP_ID=MMETSP0799-20121207/10505_1 /TAXON_ID=46947 /ORGANISM="Geminigera cryophila, Strain CCMP2564" /LENGTH=783 /DNA_ID=CAMNT_0021196723 /DNA_START=344 /DNA_END=2692 /DNA_ORIENTATION=+
MAATREDNASNQNRRVKVYVLGSDGQWDDRGTGYVTCELISEHDALGLRVLSEQESNKELLSTKIFEEEVFQRQGDTIVTWTNPETREDVALSFQEAAGAQEVWEIICQVQGRSPLDEGGEDAAGGGGNVSDGAGSDLKLPLPDMENLQHLQDIVSNATSATRDRIVDGVMADGYLATLLSIFRDCEDLEMTNSLHTLFRIFKGLIMLNEPSLIEACLSDSFFLDTMGILEYDPDYAKHEMKHREYLQSPGLFKQAVPITHQPTLAKIHLNFRLTYLKDVVMARYIDDISFSTMRELIQLNNVEIIAHIQADTPFLNKLFQVCGEGSSTSNGIVPKPKTAGAAALAGDKKQPTPKTPAPKDKDTSTPKEKESAAHTKRINGFLFLRELFEMAKGLQMAHQMSFFRALSTVGLFAILEEAIKSHDARIVSASTEMMLSTLNHDASMLRSYLIKESSSQTQASKQAGNSSREPQGLLASLIHALLHYQDTGLKAQIGDIVRYLLDSTAMDVSPERDSFLNLFYDEHMDTLLSPFLQPDMWTEEGQLAKDVQNDTEEEEAAKAKIAAAVALNGTARGMPSQAHRDALTEMACVAARRRERKACWDCARKHVVELLSFSVEHHGHRIKYYMLRNNVMQAVTALLAAVDKHLVLTALKFLRQCVGVGEVFYNRYIVKKDLFKGVMNLLSQHLHRNNLINSAIIELFDHIRVKNVKELINYMVDKYRTLYEKLDYVDTYKNLLVKYEQNQQYEQDTANGLTSVTASSADTDPSHTRGARDGPRRGGRGG